MSRKNAGWTLVASALILGILHLAGVISAAYTVVLLFLFVIVLGGASKGFRKKKLDSEKPAED